MHRRRTVLAYAVAGIASLALALVIAPETSVLEGPGPLAFDPVLAARIAGWLFLLGAALFALGWEPDWARADGVD